jgi:hypothetical protein
LTFFLIYIITDGQTNTEHTTVFLEQVSAVKKKIIIIFFMEAYKDFTQWWHTANTYSQTKIPLTPMGVLAPGSAHARPSALPPIDVSRNFPAHVSAESASNISSNPSEVISEVSEP